MGVPGPADADVVVVAAGSSRRMGGVDKLAWTIDGRPLLAWTRRPGMDDPPDHGRSLSVNKIWRYKKKGPQPLR